ncbi:hypothetical protein ACWD25_54715, partial [Streptomyces sp. NPDC002920]
ASVGAAERFAGATDTAADRFSGAADTAADRFSGAADTAADRFSGAADTAAEGFARAADVAVERFGQVVAEAAVGQEAQAARQAAETRAVLLEGRDALAAAAQELRASASGLDRSVAGLPEAIAVLPTAIGEAAGSGADHIGLAYETAVTALAASLQAEVRQAGEALATRAAEADRNAQERHLASEQRLLASAAESRTVLVDLLQRVEDFAARLEGLARHEEAVRVRAQQDHRLRAEALREELALLDRLHERQERLLGAWAEHRSAADTAPQDATVVHPPIADAVPVADARPPRSA